VLAGYFADVAGRNQVILLGFANTPLYLLLGLLDPRSIPITVAAISTANSLVNPAVTGIVLATTGRSGRGYATLALTPSLGWVTGGILPGLLHSYLGSLGLYAVVAALAATATATLYAYMPEAGIGEKPVLKEFKPLIQRAWDLLAATTLANAALSSFYTVMSIEIYRDLGGNLLVYGLVLSTSTALAGALARPVSGVLVDRYGSLPVLTASLTTYIVLDTGLYITRGLVRTALWIIPVYPFRDTATVIAFSRRAPLKLQSTTAGLSATAASASGALVFAIARLTSGSVHAAYAVHIALLAASTLLVARNPTTVKG